MTGDDVLIVLDNVLDVLDRLVYLLDDDVDTEPSERTLAGWDISAARVALGRMRAAEYTRFGPNY